MSKKKSNSTRKKSSSGANRKKSNSSSASSYERRSKERIPKKKSNKKNKTKSSKESKSSSISATTMQQQAMVPLSSDLAVEADKMRRQVYQLDNECNRQIELEQKKIEKIETEEYNRLRKEHQTEIDKKVAQLKEQHKQAMAALMEDLAKRKENEVDKLKEEEESANKSIENKQLQFEKEIENRLTECNAEMDKYREKRQAEMESHIQRLRQQFEEDMKDYAQKRREAHEELVEQMRQKLELEIKNDQQKGKMDIGIKIDTIKNQYQTQEKEEVAKLERQLADNIEELKQKDETAVNNELDEIKKNLKLDLEKKSEQITTTYKNKRSQLEKELDSLEATIQGHIKQEQREIERRTKMKKELLQMLNMPDLIKLADEEFITSKYHYVIKRNNMLMQNNISSLYKAKMNDSINCYCKITVLNKWSNRHRADFTRCTTKLAHYIAGFVPNVPFVKVYDILATDTKVYTFMEPIEPNTTLQSYFQTLKKPHSSSAAANRLKGLRKEDMTYLLNQFVGGMRFLQSMFIAHANLTPDNIMLQCDNPASSLTNTKLVITGLTRPIIFYNVESDQMISVKGIDICPEEPIDYYGPECFQSEFYPNQMDAYSLGIIMYQMVRLRTPFHKFADSPKKVVSVKQNDAVRLSAGDESESGPSLGQLITALTQPDPRKRLPIDEVLNSSFFKK